VDFYFDYFNIPYFHKIFLIDIVNKSKYNERQFSDLFKKQHPSKLKAKLKEVYV